MLCKNPDTKQQRHKSNYTKNKQTNKRGNTNRKYFDGISNVRN